MYGRYEEVQMLLQKVAIYPFILFCLINLALYFLQIKIDDSEVTSYQEAGPALLLSKFGIEMLRVKFPLVTGYNTFAALVGLVFLLQVLITIFNPFSLVKIFCCTVLLCTLVPIDSRVSIFVPLIIICLTFIFKKISSPFICNLYSTVPYIYFIFPIMLVSIFPLLTGNIADVQREDDSEFIRFTIWAISLKVFAAFDIYHLIGYGEFGHYGSNASKQWASIFTSWTNNNLITTHNSVFSILFDMGYIGLIIFIKLNFEITSKVRKYFPVLREVAFIVGGIVLFCSIVGSTESLIGFYFPNFLMYFFFVIVAFFQVLSILKEKKVYNSHI
ncbi:O-antigen ligase family protein [Flectobacillus longus]|uniref:O-antigen ligase family protein n=1 Tax=Flectobacillus longus TaxID=2984207 RepID=UPI0024B74C1E|nr:O-antigen ligase family protein [Flectobacillus longus]MDI9880067.1 O-antigen ligase family protein [Flectobacillus longus]